METDKDRNMVWEKGRLYSSGEGRYRLGARRKIRPPLREFHKAVMGVAVLAGLLLSGATVRADSCFSLRNAAESIIVDCVEMRRGKAVIQTLCHDPEAGYRVKVNAAEGTRIPGGKTDCKPCLFSKNNSPEIKGVYGGQGKGIEIAKNNHPMIRSLLDMATLLALATALDYEH